MKFFLMREKKSKKKDLELLYQLYTYRVLSTPQIARIGGYGKWYVYKKVKRLEEKGYIHIEQISGRYIPDQNRQGNYYRITGNGIALLKKNGYLVDATADELRVSKYRLPYLLTFNELAISLEERGWETNNSRNLKKFYNLNRGDVIQGSLLSPSKDKEYAVYIFLKSVVGDTLARIKSEIDRNPLDDVLVLTRGIDSFKAVVNSFAGMDNEKERLIKSGSIKVLPFQFAKSYLPLSNDNRKVHKSFLTELGLEVLGDHTSKIFSTNVKMDYVVRHEGEEKYFVDLLDNDLMKIDEVIRYHREDYKRDGRKVLALTSPIAAHQEFHKQILGNIPHIEYLFVDPNEVIQFSYLQSSQQKPF